MITQFDVTSLLRTEIPALAGKNYPSQISLQPYTAMQFFTDYTRQMVNAHNKAMARKCFMLAEKLYQQGDKVVRLLVENCFIYSFASYEASPASDELKYIIPPVLYKAYTRQVINNHC